MLRAELGAAAAFSGITSRSWPSERGLLDPAGPMSLVTTGVGPYQVETALVVLENTHNFGGGTVQPIEAIREVRAATQAVGVAMHLDGARLWNAHVASGVALADYGSQFDTVSVCLSKGLGAPVGSVLVGSAEQMAEARIWRKRYGAGMRQVGILAAAGLYALDHNVERLADDHARAARFAAACAAGGTGSRRRHHRRDQHRRARRRRSRLGRTGVRRRPARAGRAHVCRGAGSGARRVAPRRRRRRHRRGGRRRDRPAALPRPPEPALRRRRSRR